MNTSCGRKVAAFTVAMAITTAAAAQPPPVRIDLQAHALAPEEFVRKFSQIVQIDKPFTGKLQTIVDSLSDQLGVTILYDKNAFRNDDPPLEGLESTTIRLPIMRNVRVETLFRKILDDLGGTVLIRGDHLVISTTREALRLSGHRPGTELDDDGEMVDLGWPRVRKSPIVHCCFERRPFRDVMKELSQRYPDCPVRIAPQARVSDSVSVSGTFINMSLDDALRGVAEAAGLRAVESPPGMLIVTPQQAAELQRQRLHRGRPYQAAPLQTPSYAISPPRPPQSKGGNWDDYARRIRDRQSGRPVGE